MAPADVGDGAPTRPSPRPSRGPALLREYLEAVLVAVIFALFVKAFLFEAYQVPSGSMEQNLLVGDHVVVDKLVWAPRNLPWGALLPRREILDLNRMFDTPVYRWLPAKSQIATHFLLFYVKSPEGMTKVDDVRMENGKIVVEDRASGKTLTLAASLPL